MMSMLVVVLVALGVFLYMRAAKAARLKWVGQLDLPGHWHSEDGSETLALEGSLERGSFYRRNVEREVRGTWQVIGGTLHLSVDGHVEKLALHLFSPGHLGFEDAAGGRKIYVKESSNVVPLKRN